MSAVPRRTANIHVINFRSKLAEWTELAKREKIHDFLDNFPFD